MATVKCITCNRSFEVNPARVKSAKFCSYACRGEWRSKYWSGNNNPQYQAGHSRILTCQHCGEQFAQRETEAISEFMKRKFCSMECAKYGQKRLTGEAHPLFKTDSRRKQRRGKHGAWARAVISRDKGVCQQCGAQEGLQAHHILSFAEHPEKRWDIDNGLTLCYMCHWAVHAALNANGVNSGNIQPGNAEDNPEPSFGRKPIEGVTTRGRAYRRWQGSCSWCGAFLSKRWSDVVGKAHLFCNKHCMGKHRAATRTYRRWKNAPTDYGSNASTSAPPERDDIV